jgi:hypothetical protein
MSRKPAWVAALGLLAAALAVALLLGEGLLRLAGQSYYWAIAKRSDPILGWRPPPHIAAWQRFEGAALVRTNGLGFRDDDHPRRKPPGTLRIAVLGDSFTEAVQVPIDATWWQVMTKRLRGPDCALAKPLETLSFAVSGYSTAQSLLAWRAHARDFAPDAAVLALFIGNDLTENHPALDAEPLRPYFRLRDGELVLDDDFRRGAVYRKATSASGQARQWLLEHSRIAQLFVQARDALRLRAFAKAAPPGDRAAPAAEPREPGVDNAVYRPPADAVWRESWEVTEAMLAAFAREVRSAGAEPVLMLIGTGAQVHPDPRVPRGFAAALGLADLGYPVRRLLDAAERHGMAVLNLPALLAAQAERDDALLHGFPGGRPGLGHWNAAGHAAAGAAAAALLCDRLAGAAAAPAGAAAAPAVP